MLSGAVVKQLLAATSEPRASAPRGWKGLSAEAREQRQSAGARLSLGRRRASSASSPPTRRLRAGSRRGARALGPWAGAQLALPASAGRTKGVSGRGQPSGWRGEQRSPARSRRREGAQHRGARSYRCVEASPADPPPPIHRRARTGARECSHTHARLRTPWPGCVSWARVGAGVEGESGELRAMR